MGCAESCSAASVAQDIGPLCQTNFITLFIVFWCSICLSNEKKLCFSGTGIKNWYPELMFLLGKFRLNFNKAAVIYVSCCLLDSLSKVKCKTQHKTAKQTSDCKSTKPKPQPMVLVIYVHVTPSTMAIWISVSWIIRIETLKLDNNNMEA